MKMFAGIAIAALTMAGVASAQDVEIAHHPGMPITWNAVDGIPGEVEMMAKSMGGRWRCIGKVEVEKSEIVVDMTVKLDFDKWWIEERMESKPTLVKKGKLLMVAYTTFDPTARLWRRIVVWSEGRHMVGTSPGMKDGKMTWDMVMVGPMATEQVLFRTYVDTTDPRGMKIRGEHAIYRGMTFDSNKWGSGEVVKFYEMTCRK